MKKIRNQPITGATPEYGNNRRPILPNAKDTSANAEAFIKAPPTPFRNDQEAATIPAGTAPRISPGTRSGNPSSAAVGQSRMPNQSAQIGGRTSVAASPRKSGDNSKGFPAHKNAKLRGFYAEW